MVYTYIGVCVRACVFRRVRKIAKSDYQLCHDCLSIRLFVSLSVCMQQLGSQWKDFYETWYLSFFRKFSTTFNFL